MRIYQELFEKARTIQSLLLPEKAFTHDEWGGVAMSDGRIWDDVDRLSDRFDGNAKVFLQLTAKVLEAAAADTGFGKLRVVDGEFGKITVSIRGGFPAVPKNETPAEQVERIMGQRSGIDVTLGDEKLFLTPCIGWLNLSRSGEISPIGDISWEIPLSPVFPEGQDPDKYLKELSDGLGELTRLNVAAGLLSLVQNKVEGVVNS